MNKEQEIIKNSRYPFLWVPPETKSWIRDMPDSEWFSPKLGMYINLTEYAMLTAYEKEEKLVAIVTDANKDNIKHIIFDIPFHVVVQVISNVSCACE